MTGIPLGGNVTVVATLEGYIGTIMGQGKNQQHNGQLIVTNQRVVFYRKGFLGEVFETIPLSKITSIEQKSFLGHRAVTLHTSHDELSFKTFENRSSKRWRSFTRAASLRMTSSSRRRLHYWRRSPRSVKGHVLRKYLNFQADS
jgi:hypothetical protein